MSAGQNTQDIVAVIGPGGLPIGHRSHERPPRFMPAPVVVLNMAQAPTLTGPVAETELASAIVPGGLIGPNGTIEGVLLFSMTPSAAANRTIRIRYGSLQLIAYTPTNTTQSGRITSLAWAISESQLKLVSATNGTAIGTGQTSTPITTAGIDTTQDQALTVSVQIDGTGDEVQVIGARVAITPTE